MQPMHLGNGIVMPDFGHTRSQERPGGAGARRGEVKLSPKAGGYSGSRFN